MLPLATEVDLADMDKPDWYQSSSKYYTAWTINMRLVSYELIIG